MMQRKPDKPSFLKIPPVWVVCLVVIAVIASWVPLVLIARSRAIKSERSPVHMFLDMDFQPRLGPQDFQSHDLSVRFNDGRAMRPVVPGAVRYDQPTHGAELDDDHFFRGYQTDGNLKPITDEALVEGNPVQVKRYIPGYPDNLTVDEKFIRRGQDRYNIYCGVCHGRAGYGDGPVHRRIAMRGNLDPTAIQGWVQPRDLHLANIVAQPPSQIYDVITHGFNNMRGYAAQVNAYDRWAIAAYVKALQLSQNFDRKELPAEMRAAAPKPPEVPAEALIAEGKKLFMSKICFTCHQADPNIPAVTGEVMKATKFMGEFWGLEREVHDGGPGGPVIKVKLDEGYFLESVEFPMKKIVKGALPGMAPLPTTPEERKALMFYVRSLSRKSE